MQIREIIGNTTSTPTPRSDWNQEDSTKADYIKNKPDIERIIADQFGGLKFYINTNGKLTLSIEED